MCHNQYNSNIISLNPHPHLYVRNIISLECNIIHCYPLRSAMKTFQFHYFLTTVRLNAGDRKTHGRVEINRAGSWGVVCDVGWSDLEATVACRQLGFLHGRALPINAYNSIRDTNIETSYTSVVCNGNETSLDQCSTRSDYCSSPYNTYASVHCFNTEPESGKNKGLYTCTQKQH